MLQSFRCDSHSGVTVNRCYGQSARDDGQPGVTYCNDCLFSILIYIHNCLLKTFVVKFIFVVLHLAILSSLYHICHII